MRSAAATVPGVAASRSDTRAQPVAQRVVAEQSVDRARQLLGRVRVRVEPHAEAGLVEPLGVVVLIPEEREDHGGLAEPQRLGDRVVAAVRDHEVDVREDRDLRQELGAGHVRGELELIVLRALGHHDPAVDLRELADQRAHELDVARAERAEAQVDQRGVTGRRLPWRVGVADARLEVVPRAVERPRARVVDLVRIQVEVQVRGVVDELELRQRRARRARGRTRRSPRAGRRACAGTPPGTRPTRRGRPPRSRRTSAVRQGP